MICFPYDLLPLEKKDWRISSVTSVLSHHWRNEAQCGRMVGRLLE